MYGCDPTNLVTFQTMNQEPEQRNTPTPQDASSESTRGVSPIDTKPSGPMGNERINLILGIVTTSTLVITAVVGATLYITDLINDIEKRQRDILSNVSSEVVDVKHELEIRHRGINDSFNNLRNTVLGMEEHVTYIPHFRTSMDRVDMGINNILIPRVNNISRQLTPLEKIDIVSRVEVIGGRIDSLYNIVENINSNSNDVVDKESDTTPRQKNSPVDSLRDVSSGEGPRLARFHYRVDSDTRPDHLEVSMMDDDEGAFVIGEDTSMGADIIIPLTVKADTTNPTLDIVRSVLEVKDNVDEAETSGSDSGNFPLEWALQVELNEDAAQHGKITPRSVSNKSKAINAFLNRLSTDLKDSENIDSAVLLFSTALDSLKKRI